MKMKILRIALSTCVKVFIGSKGAINTSAIEMTHKHNGLCLNAV